VLQKGFALFDSFIVCFLHKNWHKCKEQCATMLKGTKKSPCKKCNMQKKMQKNNAIILLDLLVP
jgi:hypothetical protein